jgi:aminoglycoside phosphotransferase (APT) family kinase protein
VNTMHDDQVVITVDTATELVRDQFPEWRGLDIGRFDSSGTVNAIFRVGRELSARFPLRPVKSELMSEWLHEGADAMREFALHCPFPTPLPKAVGLPGHGYPMPWSVQTWIGDDLTSEVDAGRSTELAVDLAALISALRSVDTRGRIFSGVGRGGDLRSHDDWMETCFNRSEDVLDDIGELRELWSEMRELPRGAPDVMSHGDLIPGNLLVRDGRLVGVLDTEGFRAADPSFDLVAGWSMLEDGPRRVFRDRLGSSDIEWARGRAWAFVQAMGATWYYVTTNPAMSGMGRLIIDRLLAEPEAL